MSWHLVIPANLGRERKTRLSARLSTDRREALSDAMLAGVLEAARGCGAIARISVLSPMRPTQPDIGWIEDMGGGLNAELTRAASLSGPVAIVHGDLPLLSCDDLSALVAAATTAGVAIAPDGGGGGTNALALVDSSALRPQFGEGSFARHRAAYPDADIVVREGLGFDIDSPADLDALIERGLPPELAAAIA